MAVLEAGSFEGAARRLNATPPAVSKRISELESELGVRLFERTTRSCHMTLRGRALVPFAQRVLADIGEIQRTVGERSSLTGHIRLGLPETIAYTLLPEILRSVSADLPQLTMGIEVGLSIGYVREVRTRELDIACVVGPVLDQDLISEPFCDVPLALIAAGPTWTEEPLTIDELAKRTILLPARGRHIPVIEGWFKSRGVRVQTDHQLQQPGHGGEVDEDRRGAEFRADRMRAAGTRCPRGYAGSGAAPVADQLVRDDLSGRPDRARARRLHRCHARACVNFEDVTGRRLEVATRWTETCPARTPPE